MTEKFNLYPHLNQNLVNLINNGSKRGEGVALLEVNRGCGVGGHRQCRICQMNSPTYQGSMPFKQVKSILETLKPLENEIVPLFRTGDPIYYRDGEKDINDVVQVALENHWIPSVRTHGCLSEETHAKTALAKLANTHNRIGGFGLEFSLDTYGFEGLSYDGYLDAAFQSLQLLDSARPRIELYFRRDEPNDIQMIKRILDDKRFMTLQKFRKRLKFNEIQPYGRARTLFGIKGENNLEPWSGHAILYDGEVLNKPKFREPIIIQMGNIFT